MLRAERSVFIYNSSVNTTGCFMKISRAIYNLSQPPVSLPQELLVNQASKEIVAAEKLRVLESRKDIGRAPEKRPAERHWRDIRIPT